MPGKKTAKKTATAKRSAGDVGGVGGNGKGKKVAEAAIISSPAGNGIRTRNRSAALGSKAKRRTKRASPPTSAPVSRMRTRQYDSELFYAPLDDEDTDEEEDEEEDMQLTGRPVALCLGMIRMTDEFMDGYKGCADPMLDVAAVRDTCRMRILEDEVRRGDEGEGLFASLSFFASMLYFLLLFSVIHSMHSLPPFLPPSHPPNRWGWTRSPWPTRGRL